ncbi:MAG: hypothetical protein HY890_02375 [Deltaproteobacteria bacterium]|nr:hypothetical protein [Deltaproteobacteria bacterium]
MYINKKILSGEAGGISMRALFYLIVLGLLTYAGYMVVPPYFEHYMFTYEVTTEAKTAWHYSDDDIRKHLLDKVDYWGMPIRDGNIKIERGMSDIEITVAYEVRLNFFDRYRKTLYYKIYVKKPIVEVINKY